MTDSITKKQAQRLRLFRKIHRLTGACLFIFFFVVSTTGLLLGWKKHTGGAILPESSQGRSTNPKDWLPLDVLHERALTIAREEISKDLSPELERIDVRPDKGMVKFVFVEDYRGLQLDLSTGELLQIERRRSDFIENIHDGSVLDYLFGTGGEYLKLVYTTVMGTALITFTITGFWLWFGPKRMRRTREAEIAGN
jgi:uncharacterized iron-regulated membrane protein